MKLIRFDGNKTGLVVELASGIHVVDVIASIGALVPEDPISHGVLNGLLKDNGSWAQLIQHWGMARIAACATSRSSPNFMRFVRPHFACVASAHSCQRWGRLSEDNIWCCSNGD